LFSRNACRMLQARCWLFLTCMLCLWGNSSLYFRGFYIGSALLKASPPLGVPYEEKSADLGLGKKEKMKFKTLGRLRLFCKVVLTFKCKIFVDCQHTRCGWRFFLLYFLGGMTLVSLPALLCRVPPTWVEVSECLESSPSF